MASRRKNKRRSSNHGPPLVKNPFDAAKKRKRQKEREKEEINKLSDPNTGSTQNNNFFSSLPFIASQTQSNNLSMDSNDDQWMKSKQIEHASQSMDGSHSFLTPMDQPQQSHLSQFDVQRKRIFNHTKSKLELPKICNEASEEFKENEEREHVKRSSLLIPALNEYLDENERIDLSQYREQNRKGVVVNDRYHRSYVEMEQIGTGSFGKVYKVRNRDDGSYCACKKIRIHSMKSENRASIKKEGMILSALQRNSTCQNLIFYISMWIESDFFFLFTEYADNGNLYQLRKTMGEDCKFGDDIFCKILSEMSNALMFIHEQNFIHFDVKPDNILISKSLTFKLADFGLCTKVDSNLSDSDFPKFEEGDSRYLCRELIEQSYSVSELDKIDVFALGLSVFEMMIWPKSLPSNGFQWQQIRNGNLAWNEVDETKVSASQNMRQLIQTLIHCNPNERPPAKQLNAFLTKCNDQNLQQKENQIKGLKQKIKILIQQNRRFQMQ